MHKFFSYVVTTDVGVAPNVDGGVCTAVSVQAGDTEERRGGGLDRRPLAHAESLPRDVRHAGWAEVDDAGLLRVWRLRSEEARPIPGTPDNIYERHQLLGLRPTRGHASVAPSETGRRKKRPLRAERVGRGPLLVFRRCGL